MLVTITPFITSTPSFENGLFGLGGEVLREGTQHARPALHKKDASFLRINMPKIVLQGFIGDFRQRPGQLQPSSARAYDDKVSHACTSSRLAARSARSKA